MRRGMNQIIEAIRPTLGPRPRVVAIDRVLSQKMPELLDDGGTIAKRIVQLQNLDEDVGAMFVRGVLWNLHDQVGDGTATAAVLLQKIYNEGARYLASGGNAMRLKDHLEEGLRAILDEIRGMTVQVEGEENLARIAESICHDAALAKMMGEIFDIVGEFGRLEIRTGQGRELDREYTEGMYWERGLLSREMITNHKQMRTELEDSAILISDLEIQDPRQILPVLELVIKDKLPALLIVAGKLSDGAIAFLLANRGLDGFRAAAVQTPGRSAEDQAWALEDLAVLTGGRPFVKAAGDTFEGVRLEDLGRARRVWADCHNFGIVGGKGDPRAIRQHIAALQAAYEAALEAAPREKLLKRIGKLLGGSATLWVGGATELEIESRQAIAERTAAAMRCAMMEGVVPGGGVALLGCRPALQRKMEQSTDADERAAYRILVAALEEPTRTIVANAGYDVHETLGQINLARTGYGFDVNAGQVVDMMEAGISDASHVLKSAVYVAVGSAALALTVDVLVHRQERSEPAATPKQSKRKRL